MRFSFWTRHRWLKWFALSVLVLIVGLTIATVIAARRAEPFLRALIIQRLEERFNSHVELDSFHVSIAQGLRAQGKGLRIWAPAEVAGMTAGPNAPGKPLIDVGEFRFRAPLHYSSNKPIRISMVDLRGVTIDIPPRHKFLHLPEAASAPESEAAAGTPPRSTDLLRFKIDTVLCNGAHLILETSNPAKLPLVFDIQNLKVMDVSSGHAMGFQATLTNPRPKGLIVTKGSLGPWAVEDPGSTPLDGNYSFNHADLGTFKGISGTLDSTGRYRGELDRLIVDGVTDTPNFALTRFGTALPLHTDFHATVDATNGDTRLQPVSATLGHTHFVAQGKVVGVPAVPAAKGKPGRRAGHDIELNVDVEHGEIGDFVRLTSHSGEPLLTGTLHMQTSLAIPPGSNPVHERLRLKGNFILEDAQFNSEKLQNRIAELSLRGEGKPDEAKSAATKAAADVRSTMTSTFTMDKALIRLPDLKYMVPGAEVDLHGTYDVDGGGLYFRGIAKMQATVSQMVGGWKGILLKPVDRFFKKHGAGTSLHVHVDGTRDDPHFGVDF